MNKIDETSESVSYEYWYDEDDKAIIKYMKMTSAYEILKQPRNVSKSMYMFVLWKLMALVDEGKGYPDKTGWAG